jgi:ABC-type sugar transport system ATPase subunit
MAPGETAAGSAFRAKREPLSAGVPVLEARALAKHYGGVTAVGGFDLRVGQGEIVALVGDNGAGKSTVIKMLAGAVTPDTGSLVFRGEPVVFQTPLDARRAGIETVWQNLAIARDYDIPANMFLGRELVHGSRWRMVAPLRNREMSRHTTQMLLDMGIDISRKAGVRAGDLSGGQVQALAIARAAAWAKDLLLLDEPTAALGVKQSGIVLDLCRHLRSQGISIVIISHSMPDVLSVSDRIVVMRHGGKVFDGPTTSLTHETLVQRITGLYPREAAPDTH